MTTATPDEDDALVVSLVQATRRVKGGTVVGLLTEIEVRRILAVLDLPARDARVAAQAWDEGYKAGWRDTVMRWGDWVKAHDAGLVIDEVPEDQPNPYRSTPPKEDDHG